MIVNIPITVDEKAIEFVAGKDLDKKIDKYVKNLIVDAIQSSHGYSDNDKMRRIIEDRIDVYFEDHMNEIVEMAAKRIDERVRNRKKIKEVLNERA